MGQILQKLQVKEWRHKQLRQITNGVFDQLRNDSGRPNLTFEDLYIAVLLIYNKINRGMPGPHFDPPSREHVRAMIREHDMDLDGQINREEFVYYIQKLTADTIITVSQGLIKKLAIANAFALLTKRATQGVPVFGKVVQRLPDPVYASLVSLAVLVFQNAGKATS